MHSWLLVCCSALLFSVAFLWPPYCFWTVFIFFMPLWQLFIKRHSSFCKGYVWGIICWSLQLSALLVFLFEHGSGSAALRTSAWILLVLYLSVYAGIWFWLIKMMLPLFRTVVTHSLVIILITSAYFYWIHRAAFFIFGRVFGYPFSNPLLPVMIISHLFNNEQRDNAWRTTVEVVAPYPYAGAWDRAYDFLDSCKKIIAQKPHTKVIITPESAFPFPLNRYPEFIALWSDYPGLEHIHFLIDAHRQEGEKLFNTLYYIHAGRIIQYYDKKTTLLIAEELPTNKLWRWTEKLFLADKKTICSGSNERTPIFIDGFPKLLPYICSDLFFCYDAPKEDNAAILCVANDNWFSMSYIKKLMQLHVQFKEYSWQKQILYVSDH